MNKIFYAIYNKEENKFLCVTYNYGEETYYAVNFDKIGRSLFSDKIDVRIDMIEYINRAENNIVNFGEGCSVKFIRGCSIVPVEISIKFDLITEE